MATDHPFGYAFCLLTILLMLGCTTAVSQQQAEAAASQFMQERVKFFSSSNESTEDINQTTTTKMTSYQKGSDWAVVIHVEASVGNDTKKNDLLILVDGHSGEVRQFNGKPVIEG